ncbi:MAG: hypothetical protein AB7U98_09565 [Candidatus Nitrosocosmicus sp.]
MSKINTLHLKLFFTVMIFTISIPIFSTQSNGAFKDYKLDCKIVEEGSKYYSMECCETAKRTENGEEVPFGCTLYSCEKGGECIAEDGESIKDPSPIDDKRTLPPYPESNFKESESLDENENNPSRDKDLIIYLR